MMACIVQTYILTRIIVVVESIFQSHKIATLGPRTEVNVRVNRTREGNSYSAGSDDDAVEMKMM
jgi:hypothetical protein